MQNSLFSAVVQQLQQRTEFALAVCEPVALRLVAEYKLKATKSVYLQKLSPEALEIELLQLLSLQVKRIGKYAELRTQAKIWALLRAVLRRRCSGIVVSLESAHDKRELLIEQFLTEYLSKVWQKFCEEQHLPAHYQPRHPIQQAEWAAYVERYSCRKIRWLGGEEYLIRLRARDFNQRQSRDERKFTSKHNEDIDEFASENEAPVDRLERQHLQSKLVEQLMQCFQERKQEEVVRYFALLLSDASTSEIDTQLGLSTEERERLQERYKFHRDECLFRRYWRERLEALGHNLETLGLTPKELQAWHTKLTPEQQKIWAGWKGGASESEIAASVEISVKQIQSLWRDALLSAEKFRKRA